MDPKEVTDAQIRRQSNQSNLGAHSPRGRHKPWIIITFK